MPFSSERHWVHTAGLLAIGVVVYGVVRGAVAGVWNRIPILGQYLPIGG